MSPGAGGAASAPPALAREALEQAEGLAGEGQRSDIARMSMAHLIQAHRQEVLENWKEQVRTLGDARALSEPALVDHVPQLLDWLLARQREGHAAGDFQGHLLSREHADERFEEKFDLVELLAEMSVLRDVLLRLWVEAPGGVLPREVLQLSQDLDDVVTVAATEFVRQILRRGGDVEHAPAH